MTNPQKHSPFLYHVRKGESEMLKEIPNYIKISEKYNTCKTCNTKMRKDYSSELYTFEVDGKQMDITVTNVPIHKCPQCNTKYYSFRIGHAVEQLLDKEIFYMLNNRQRDEIPNKVDFSEFLNYEIQK